MFSTKKTQSFNEIVSEAFKERKEFEKLIRPAKLTAKAFMQDASKIGNVTEDDLNKIEDYIKGPGFEMSRIFLRKAVDYILTPECSMPSPKTKSLSHLMRYEFDSIVSEMAVIRYTPFALFALASSQAIQKDPGAFGDVEDMSLHQEKLRDTEARLQNLYKKIETQWGADDVDIVPAGGDLAYIRYKGTEVSVFGRNSGEALINHLVNTK